jgi:hypothetical protein
MIQRKYKSFFSRLREIQILGRNSSLFISMYVYSYKLRHIFQKYIAIAIFCASREMKPVSQKGFVLHNLQ